MYRTMALSCYRAGIKADEEEKVVAKCREAEISIRYENGVQKMKLNNEDVSGEIRQEVIGNMTSAIAVYGPVRERLVEMQRDIASKNNVVMDGRDIGTNVLPNADDCNIEDIEKDIKDRDYRDMNREISPLKKADDAVLIDSSNMNIEEVVNKIKELAKEGK